MAPRDKGDPLHGDDPPHRHVQAGAMSGPAPYLEIVDDLFGRGHIDAGKRDFLRRGLAAAEARR